MRPRSGRVRPRQSLGHARSQQRPHDQPAACNREQHFKIERVRLRFEMRSRGLDEIDLGRRTRRSGDQHRPIISRAVATPAPREQRQEDHYERPGESDHSEDRQIADTLRPPAGPRDEDLLQEEKRRQPMKIGDVEPNFARVGGEDEGEHEPGFAGQIELRRGEAGSSAITTKKAAAL